MDPEMTESNEPMPSRQDHESSKISRPCSRVCHRWRKGLATAIVSLALGACGGDVSTVQLLGGESHFLQKCDTNGSASCGSGLDCIAGICTESCLVSESTCTALFSRAICTAAGVEPGVVTVCDVSCSTDAECTPLGDAHRCEAGFCRAPASSGVIGGNTSDGIGASEQPLSVLIEGERQVADLAMDDQYLYWTADGSQIRRMPIEGGEIVTLLSGANELGSLQASGGFIYYVTDAFSGPSGVWRVPRESGEPQELASSRASIGGIAVTDALLYWHESPGLVDEGSIGWANVDGSGSGILFDGAASPTAMDVDSQYVYFSNGSESCEPEVGCRGGGVWRLPRQGGDAQAVDRETMARDLVVNERGLYWLVASPPRVMFAAPGGAPRVLAEVLADGTGDGVLDGDGLYWTTGERLLRLPLDGGEPQRLLADRTGLGDLVASGDWVYVIEREAGRVLRVAKDGSANRPRGPITGPCPAPVGDAAEIALTPRADENLEQLALSLTPERLTADTAIYDRIVLDIAAIRALAPDRADIGYFAPDDGKTIWLGLDDITSQSVRAGEYSAWDCLNDFFGLQNVVVNHSDLSNTTSVLIELDGIYNVPLLVQQYAQLPGVVGANAHSVVGDGSSIYVQRDGDQYRYDVDRAGGDCPAGCTEHDIRTFISGAPGVVTESPADATP
jgi:hypothetical protein